MVKSKSARIFSLVGAILYTLFALHYVCDNLLYSIRYSDFEWIGILDIFFWITLFGLSITLFIGKKIPVLVAAGAIMLLDTHYIVNYFSATNLFFILTSTTLVAILILSILRLRVVKFLWFLPGSLMFICDIIDWIDYGYFSYLSDAWLYMLRDFVQVAVFFLIGLWLNALVPPKKSAAAETESFDFEVSPACEPVVEAEAAYEPVVEAELIPETAFVEPAPVVEAAPVEEFEPIPDPVFVESAPIAEPVAEPTPVVEPAPAAAAVDNEAHALLRYKELLDAGILTQEEFDAKKKQILGL